MQDLKPTAAPAELGVPWRHRFAGLGPAFHTRLAPMALRKPYWVARSQSMARALGLDEGWWRAQAVLEAFSGNRPLAGSEPLASVYSGHQFGVWAGQLGDAA